MPEATFGNGIRIQDHQAKLPVCESRLDLTRMLQLLLKLVKESINEQGI
jgi:hypothetical protein